MSANPSPQEKTLDLRHLGELALQAVKASARRLDQVGTYDIDIVRRFIASAREIPFVHLLGASGVTEEQSLVGGGGARRPRKKASRIHAISFSDILALPVEHEDEDTIWDRRWALGVEIHGLAVADLMRPEGSRNTWFAKHLQK